MYKKRGKRYILLINIVLISVFFLFYNNAVSASFTKGSPTEEIKDIYAAGEKISGWINISLESESTDSMLKTNLDNKISLLDFLYANGLKRDVDFTCSPATDCSKSYDTNSPETEKRFSLVPGQEKMISFVINDASNIQIRNLILNLSSDAGDSCMNQIEIDILDNNEINWQNNKLKLETCYNKKQGCYDSDAAIQLATVENVPYCEMIRLNPAPGFKLGAWIKTEQNSGQLKMLLYEEDIKKAECNLTAPSDEGEIFCNVDYNVFSEKDYYICIKSNQSSGFKIKFETSEDNCGFMGTPLSDTNFSTDYSLSAQSLKFNRVHQNVIDLDSFSKSGETGYNLTNYIQQYLDEKYSGVCGDCTVPIRFVAKTSQTITVQGTLKYDKQGAGGIENANLYDSEKVESKINMGFVKLDIGKANFSSPKSYGNHTLKIDLQESNILEKEIITKKLPAIFALVPTTVPAAIENKFYVIGESMENLTNIVEYRWEFGDNTTAQTTTKNNVLHKYDEIGTYDLKITIKDHGGTTNTKTYSINVISPIDAINKTLKKKKQFLSNIKTKIDILPNFQKDAIREKLDVSLLIDKISGFESEYMRASTDEEYIGIIKNLSELRIPYEIMESVTAELDFFNDGEKIDLNKLAELSLMEGEIGDSSIPKYKDAISYWFYENIEAKIAHKTISAFYENSIEELVTVQKITLTPKSFFEYETFFIIDKQINELFFKENYEEEELQDGTQIIFENSDSFETSKNIEFAVTGFFEVYEIPMYLSPELGEIDIERDKGICNFNRVCEKWLGETSKNCKTDCFRWGFFIFFIMVLLILFLIAYIALQEWYKRRYEGYLFKNKNDIYNLANFIENARNQGLSENKIIKKLEKSGWSYEQIVFVIKKIQGKRAGMWEIPVFKWLEKANLKKGMEKVKKKRQEPLKLKGLKKLPLK